MIVNTFQCDGCGIQKGETNHWFRWKERPNQFGVGAWDASPEPTSDEKHLCSDACVVKAVQGWLSAQKEAQ